MKKFSPAWHLQKDGLLDTWLEEHTRLDDEAVIHSTELFESWMFYALSRRRQHYSLPAFTQEMIRRGFRWFSAGDGPLFGGIELK